MKRALLYLCIFLFSALMSSKAQNLSLSTHQHDFGTIPLNLVSDFELIMQNTGTQAVIISDLVLPDTNFYFQSPAIPFSLAPNDTAAIRLYFQPLTSGAHETYLYIWLQSQPGTPVDSVHLTGMGDASPVQQGTILWQFQGGDDVWAIVSPGDVDGDGYADVAVESYDAGVPMTMDHLFMFKGNSFGSGVKIWSIRPAGGLSNSGGYGQRCLSTISDLTGDGLRDIILGTAWGGRSVYAIDASNGQVLWIYDTYLDPLGDGWVYAVEAISDVNGDGFEDVLAAVGGSSTGGNRSALCIDGKSQGTGQLIWRYQMNDALTDIIALNDIDQDSIDDAVAGAGGNFIDNRAIALSGGSVGTAVPLWDFTAGNAVQNLGRLRDIDGDGIDEVLVGSWDGNVYCLSGVNGAQLWTRTIGPVVMEVDAIDDLNGDGYQDVLVGSWADLIYVLNGHTGEFLWSYQTGGDVWTVDPVGDLTGDGIPEVLGGSFDGSVYCLEGTSGTLLWSVNLGNKLYTVRGLPDLNNDGWPEVGGGTQHLYGQPTGGEVYIIQGATQIVSIGNSLALQAHLVGEGVELSWNLPAAPVSGFNVYRLQLDRTAFNKIHQTAELLAQSNVQAAQEYLLHQLRVSVYDGYEKLNKEVLQQTRFIDTEIQAGKTYRYVVGAVLPSGKEELSPYVEIQVNNGLVPASFQLYQNYPNPFNPETKIRFDVPRRTRIKLEVFDLLGRRVATLLEGEVNPGMHEIVWDGHTENGPAASGIYFYRLTAGKQHWQRKMMLIK